jgi:elongation factor Ts
MQIVFSPPASLDRAGLDPAIVAKEREVFLARVKNDPKNSSKPPQILDKIVEGQLNEFVASKSLLDQVSIRDSKQTVTQFVKSSGAGVSVKAFAYVATDIEK